MDSKKSKVPDAREKVLEAAMKLFSENGFHATTTRKIAQEADVNEVTLFRHFPSKLGLFQEILQIVKQVGFNADWIKDLDLEPVEAIRYAIERALENIESQAEKFRILMYALLDRVEGFEDQYVNEQIAVGYGYLTEIFEKLKQRGCLLSEQDPEILTGLLMSQIIATMQFRNLLQSHPLQKLNRKQISDAIVRLFIKTP